jgi:hypothetical protein
MADTQQPTEATGKDQPSETGKDKNVEFRRLRKSDLKSVPLFVQALDNQWLPCSLLREALKKGGVTPSIERKLTKLVRAEYMRALLNSEQVIINRPYIGTYGYHHNSLLRFSVPAMVPDYSSRSSSNTKYISLSGNANNCKPNANSRSDSHCTRKSKTCRGSDQPSESERLVLVNVNSNKFSIYNGYFWYF